MKLVKMECKEEMTKRMKKEKKSGMRMRDWNLEKNLQVMMKKLILMNADLTNLQCR